MTRIYQTERGWLYVATNGTSGACCHDFDITTDPVLIAAIAQFELDCGPVTVVTPDARVSYTDDGNWAVVPN